MQNAWHDSKYINPPLTCANMHKKNKKWSYVHAAEHAGWGTRILEQMLEEFSGL